MLAPAGQTILGAAEPAGAAGPARDAADGVLGLLQTGGWVMNPLLALSLVSIALVLERLVFWSSLSGSARRRRIDRASDALRRAKPAEARRAIGNDVSVYGRIVSALAEAMEHAPVGDGVALEAIDRVRPGVERFTTALSTIITAAPILGILGTVLGIIDSFEVLGSSVAGEGQTGGTVHPMDVAAGIAKALYTTAFGLIIAIATLLPYAAIRARAARCLLRLETIAGAAIDGSHTPGAPGNAGGGVARHEPGGTPGAGSGISPAPGP